MPLDHDDMARTEKELAAALSNWPEVPHPAFLQSLGMATKSLQCVSEIQWFSGAKGRHAEQDTMRFLCE